MKSAIGSDLVQAKVDQGVNERLAMAGMTLAGLTAGLKLSFSNSKLKKTGKVIKKIGLQEFSSQLGFQLRGHNIASFNLPAGGYKLDGFWEAICIGAAACLALCYAMQGSFTWASTQIPRVVNHQLLERLQGRYRIAGMIHALDRMIKRLGPSYGLVRLHDSGDFYSQTYIDAWMQVIRMNPTIWFYLYTKSHHLLPDDLPENLSVTKSFGGKHDDLIDTDNDPHARIFATVQELIDAGYIDANDEVDGEIATILGRHKIGLAYHGVKKPTPAQLRAVA
tara:strand:+ start:412 stop:1248 length:837 start_codon:yes stop_codon:yes gene_type:complete